MSAVEAHTLNWSRWPNFTEAELRCSHTGECVVDPRLLDCLQELRDAVGTALVVSSGYRHPTHPEEAKKEQPGAHALGLAVDLRTGSHLAYRILTYAPSLGFTGIGVSQRQGAPRFVHLDIWQEPPRPNVWSY